MYELSRDLFRALRAGLNDDLRHPGQPARRLLALCEEAVAGVARTPQARRHHVARLFSQTRSLYPPGQHISLLTRIERAIEDLHRRLLANVEGRTGGLLRCAATTRRNTPCMREPIPGLRYCPSHRHLEESERLLAVS